MKIRVLVLFAMSVSFLYGCTYKVYSPQFSFAMHLETIDEDRMFRKFMEDYANRNGFTKETRAGNVEHLQAQGIYFISFKANDESYIAMNNLGDKKCYEVGIYSAKGDAGAEAVGNVLIGSLNAKKIGKRTVIPLSTCG